MEMGKEDELRAKLEAHETEQTAELREQFKVFNIDEFVADVNDVLEVEVPTDEYAVKKQEIEIAITLLRASRVPEPEKKRLTKDIEKRLKKLKPDFFIVKYKRLTNEDLLRLTKVSDKEEQALKILFTMMQKADANVTYDKVKQMNPPHTTRILTAITSKTPIFLA